MKKLLLLCLPVLLASLCWGQYTDSWKWQLADLSGYCTASTNCWKAFATLSATKMDQGIDLGTFAISGSNLYFWSQAHPAHWAQQTVAGSGWTDLAVFNASAMYLLGPTTGCTSPNKHPYFFNGSTAPAVKAGCLTSIFVNKDHQNIVTGMDSSGQWWISTNTAASWATIPILSGASTLYYSDDDHVCKVVSGVLHLQTTANGDVVFSPSPGTNINTCFWNPTATDTPTLAVATTAGVVKTYSFSTDTWKTIHTSTPINRITGYLGASIVGLASSGGQPYHYNVVVPSIWVTKSGSWGGCPTAQQPCPAQPPVTHTIHIRVTLPSGVNGLMGTRGCSPSDQCTATSWDASTVCDGFFGDPTDPNCVPVVPNDDAICSLSGRNVGTSSLPPGYIYALDAIKWNNTKIIGTPVPWGANNWLTTYQCFADNNCDIGYQSACPHSDMHGTVQSSTPIEGTEVANVQCLTGPWRVLSIYNPLLGSSSCQVFKYQKHVTTPTQCF